ncbi:hypothetical protein AW878_14175 [Bordetella pseudohinzii]|nr:hypothetical protein BBN53_21000 [Bordetella pseudohinzii]KMM24095.1 hypothetical protein L540_08180 [Bordetella pseudohinzii]KXA77839.1 hypothetical protein AW878_14175 [Bordetella pseudohinzii]KXA78035.1 hypothetical protein AW877_12635 [Bordetella pseudohinzii]
MLSYLMYLGLAVALVVLYYGWQSLGDRQNNQQIFVSDFGSLTLAAKNNRSVDGYASVTLAKLQSSRQLPSNMAGNAGGTLTHAYGGTVTLVTTQSNFTWTFAGVPAEDCPVVRNKIEMYNPNATITACAASGATSLAVTQN